MEWWRRETRTDWDQALVAEELYLASALRQCTYSGRPFGNASFVNETAEQFGRHWTRGHPEKQERLASAAPKATDTLGLF